jgi:leucyl aminopeptidase
MLPARFAYIVLVASAFAGPAQALDIRFTSGPLPTIGSIALQVADAKALSGSAAVVDKASGGALAKALASAKFDGKSDSVVTFYGLGGYDRIVVIGRKAKPELPDFEDTGGRAAEAFKQQSGVLISDDADAASSAAMALGARLSSYSYTAHKSDAKPKAAIHFTVHASDTAAAQDLYARRHSAIADGVILARDLISEPSNIKSPAWFVSRVQAAFKGVPEVSLTVLDEVQMQKLGMGMIVGSGQGSSRPPRLLVMRYRGAGSAAPLALVGKGITFDSGGISIKPSADMWRMRYDMSGAAAVTGSLFAAAKARLPINLTAVAALSENLPDGNAIRPGDVLKAMSGKTVEVQNTDAEGRLVLGDANWYIQQEDKPHSLINIATLTGSARATFGEHYAALFATNDILADKLIAAGKAAGEPLWRLPVDDAHHKDIKSDVADINNIGKSSHAGASAGAAFIAEFVKPETRWAHLDIAGIAWRDNATPTTPKGAAGYGVRLLVRYMLDGGAD